MFSILKVSGSSLESEKFYDNVAKLYNQGNITPIIYGWGSALTKKLESSGIGTKIHNTGVRITKEEDIPLLEEIAKEHGNLISTNLKKRGIPSKILYKIINAKTLSLEGITEKHYTGEYVKVNKNKIFEYTNEGIIPLIPPIGYNGSLLNINADNVATGIVHDLKPDNFILCTSPGGVVKNNQVLKKFSIKNDFGDYITNGMKLKINELKKVAGTCDIIIAHSDTFQGTYVIP